MAGIALAQRDLAETRRQLELWFEHRFGIETAVSELRAANRAAGWSSESLLFDAKVGERISEYVVRIPPTGGGIFPNYDLGAQTLTQNLLHEHGIATPSPILYEPDNSWIGSKFLVMPRIVGHTPSDTSYATRGWLHDAGPDACSGGFTTRSLRQLRICSKFRSPTQPGWNAPAVSAPPRNLPGGVST